MQQLVGINEAIHDNLSWLDADIVKYADDSIASYIDDRFADAAISAGKAIEACCRLLIDKTGGQHPQRRPPTLSDYSTPQKNKGWESAPLPAALIGGRYDADDVKALMIRLEQAARIRNKSAHGDNAILETTGGDALHIMEIVALFVRWMARNPYAESSSGSTADLRIFLSVGRPHRLDQKQFLEKLRSAMRSVGVELVNLATAEYSNEKPFPQICELMRDCHGALVIGWERVHAYTLFERERSNMEKLYQNIHLATPWNHIEGSMAATLGLPLLILKENRLHGEGIFEATSHDHKIVPFDLPTEASALSREMLRQLQGWASYLRKKSEARASGFI